MSGTSLNGGAEIRTAVLNDSVLRSAGDAFVEQQLNIDSPIFRAPRNALVRSRRIGFADCARRENAAYGNPAALQQVNDYSLGALFAEDLVGGSSTGGVSKARHRDSGS